MCYLNISSSLIRFKRALGDLQEHLEERELRGEGQRKSDTRHCDLRGLFGSGRAWAGRTCQQMGICNVCQTCCYPRDGEMGKLGGAVQC